MRVLGRPWGCRAPLWLYRLTKVSTLGVCTDNWPPIGATKKVTDAMSVRQQWHRAFISSFTTNLPLLTLALTIWALPDNVVDLGSFWVDCPEPVPCTTRARIAYIAQKLALWVEGAREQVPQTPLLDEIMGLLKVRGRVDEMHWWTRQISHADQAVV